MSGPKPSRRWWRKKRWRAFGVLWLSAASLLAWPFLLGPASYAVGRGWISGAAYEAFKAPLVPLINSPTGHRFQESTGWARWHLWWQAKSNPRLFGPVYRKLYGDGRKPAGG